MPELAEVDYYRKVWNPGIGKKIVKVHLHPEKRIFRGADTQAIATELPDRTLQSSEARGKQMVFRFSGGIWLGIHLGMTGNLAVAEKAYLPQKHDHLVLFQSTQALIFNDMRQFGRVHFFQGTGEPDWWSKIGLSVLDDAFDLRMFADALKRHQKLAIKTALLLQKEFPGIGNWMGDEIVWKCGIDPRRKCGDLNRAEVQNLYKQLQLVCSVALAKVGEELDSLPEKWLFHERWKRKGICPKHREELTKTTIGGRTTAWCPKCQK
ncbi:MAG: Fpg/Nei family DNA glycosylase [Verrucomicrobiales bacterium]